MAAEKKGDSGTTGKKRSKLKIFLITAVVVIVAVVVATYLLRAPIIRWAANKYLPLVEAQSGVGFKFSRLEVSTWGRVTLHDCRMTLNKRLFLKVKRASFRPRIGPLFSQRIVIKGLVLNEPQVFLDALPPPTKPAVKPPPVTKAPPEKPWRLEVYGLKVTDGALTWSRLPIKTPWTSAKKVNLEGDLVWVFTPDRPDIMFQAAKMSLTLDPGGLVITSLTGRVRLDGTGIKLNRFQVRTAHSSLRVTGSIQDWDMMNTDLVVGPVKVGPADLLRFGIKLPDRFAKDPINLNLSAKGPRSKLEFKLSARQKDIELTAKGTGNFGQMMKPQVRLAAVVKGFPWAWVLHRLAPKKVPANAAGPRPARDLKIALTSAADLTDFKNPGYKARVTIDNVPLRWIVARMGPPEALQAVPAPSWTFIRIEVEGRGLKPPSMTVKGSLSVGRSLLKARGDLVKRLITIRRATFNLGWGNFFVNNGRIIDFNRLSLVVNGRVTRAPPLKDFRQVAAVMKQLDRLGTPGVSVPVTVFVGGTIDKPKVLKTQVKLPRVRPGGAIEGLIKRLPRLPGF
ncbi:MAG: hypothetical protein KJ621_14540 [Proteobacteria bacterium]|nr:hypothetical protein [Pseudomonadota bacterium]